VILACEKVAMVVSVRDESRPFLARMLRNITSSLSRVVTDFWGWEGLLAIPKGMFAMEKWSAYMINVL